MSFAAPELEAAIDRLYQVPVAGFTEARSALAAERKAAGDQEGASRVKALAKPTAVAWVVNQVYWKHRELFDALAAAIAEVAAAQREARAARQAVQQAELELARRRREADTAQRGLAEAESRAAAARADVAQLETRP